MKFGCLLDGKVAWLGTTQYPIDVINRASHAPEIILVIGEQKPGPCPPRGVANGYDPMGERELTNARLVVVRDPWDISGIKMLCREAGKDFVVIALDGS